MSNVFQWRKALLIACGSVACAGSVHAASVQYTLSQLPDGAVGNHWQADYEVLGALQSFESINILFDSSSYASIELIGNTAPDSLSTSLTQPLPLLPADGELLATATSDLTSDFSSHLLVTFTWTGSGTPGAQTFQYLDDQFNVIASGTTTPAVPEPDAAWLLLSGLVAMSARTLARSRRPVEG